MSALKTQYTYTDKIDELRMLFSHPKQKGKVFIVVEGPDDIKLFQKFINPEKCDLHSIPGGKLKLEQCVKDLVGTYKLLIGIRDADFLHLEEHVYTNPNIFLTDQHDAEMMIISVAEIFSDLCFEFTSLPRNNHLDFRNTIFKILFELNCLKLLNIKEKLELNFKPRFIELLSIDEYRIDIETYLSWVIGKTTTGNTYDKAALFSKIYALKDKNTDPLQLSNGHDFIEVFAKYARKNNNTIKYETVSHALRMRYTFDHYKTTNLYRETLNWANNNNCVIY